MRVAVTGATGNVGTSVLDALAADPAVTSIVGIARRIPTVALPKVDWRAADVVKDDLVALFRGADAIVHLTWIVQPNHREADLWAVNVGGTRRVHEAVGAAGVPVLVHASAFGAYAGGAGDGPVDEAWPTDGIPGSWYSRQKAEVERDLDDFAERHPHIRVVRFRSALILKREAGAQAHRLYGGPLLPRPLVRPGRVPVVPDVPGVRIQAVHADDVGDAYRRAVVGNVRGAFNLAADPVLPGVRRRCHRKSNAARAGAGHADSRASELVAPRPADQSGLARPDGPAAAARHHPGANGVGMGSCAHGDGGAVRVPGGHRRRRRRRNATARATRGGPSLLPPLMEAR